MRVLQAQLSRLQDALQEQQRQVEELKIRMSALKMWNLVEKRRTSGITRGYLIMQYGLKEYVELAILQSRGQDVSEDQQRFFKTYSLITTGAEIEEENKTFVKSFITSRYKGQIENLIPMDDGAQTELLRKVKAA